MKSLSFFQMTESLSEINKKFLQKRICAPSIIFFYIIASSQKGTSRLIEDPYIRIYSWPNTFVSFSDIPVEHLKAELKVC